MEIELEYDEHTVLYAELKAVNADFDHAFGSENHTEFEVEELRVVTYINDFEYDVTECIIKGYPDEYARMKDAVLEHYMEVGS